jgi:two-component system response regulator MprA
MSGSVPRTVLVVDDDPWIREAVELALLSEGYAVLIARDGLEALERIERRRPDLILLDVMMPRMDGMTLVHELRRRGLGRDLPIVLVTASPGLCAEAARLGLAGCLPKPFDLAALLRRVELLTAVPA